MSEFPAGELFLREAGLQIYVAPGVPQGSVQVFTEEKKDGGQSLVGERDVVDGNLNVGEGVADGADVHVGKEAEL